jgi:Asp-tRNA(Asn)/Glu-tRNA(Gln) amidotransferase A subunit family amidase
MDLFARIDDLEARFAAVEPSIDAFLPEHARFERLREAARSLRARYLNGEERPPLFGMLVGVKDIFHVDGFPTRAGSRLPPDVLRGEQADAVTRLVRAGALIVGKTVSTEFAYFQPGPTRNPRNTAHTPGGSSSGSAAAVAAGLCELALGTQTAGSIVRPAAFCGVVGLKPTFDRISTRGVIPLSPSLDHVGVLAADVSTAARAAAVLYEKWDDGDRRSRRPVLGVPDGPYLERVSSDTLTWFAAVCRALAEAGYELRHVPVMSGLEEIVDRHQRIMAAEAARVHRRWFADYGELYGPRTAALIERGRSIDGNQAASALRERDSFRQELRQTMIESGIDAWIAPSTVGPAPRGLEATGDPVMNVPWSQAGLPAINLPTGTHASGLPMGLQVVARWNADEALLAWAAEIERTTGQL